MGSAGLLAVGCVLPDPGTTDTETTTGSTTDTVGTASTGPVESTTTAADDTATTSEGETTGPPPLGGACQPSPAIIPEPPPGSECTPGEPQAGGLCHEVVEIELPEELVVGADVFDVDGDGLLDISLVGTDWVGTLVSSPDAWPRITGFSTLPVYAGPAAMTDLDGDDAADMIVGRTPLTLLHGAGDGGLSGRVGTPVPSPLAAAAAGDVDGDGLDDLVAVHTDGSISVLRSVGGGRLATVWTRSSGCLDPLAVAAADFDGDGSLDLAVSTTDGRVTLLPGDGTGGFALGDGIDASATGTTMAAADLDGDGRPELLVADRAGSQVHALRFDGGVPAVASTIPLMDSPSAVAVADLQGDGMVDVITGHDGALVMSWAWGLGDGSFAAPGRVTTPTTTDRIVPADIDGDGFTDVVAADPKSTLTRVLGGPSGELGDPTFSFVVGNLLSYVLVDLGDDGLPEQVSVAPTGVSVAAGLPGGELGMAEPEPLPDMHTDLRFVLRARLDEDSIPDVLVVGDHITTMARLGDGAGSLRSGSSVLDGYAEWASIEVGDFDEDGLPDLVVNADQDIRVLHSDGAGNLLPGAVIAPLQVLRNPLATADLDADGHLDVVWAAMDGSLVSTVLGDGAGGFSSVIVSDLGPGETQGVQIGDVDEDGLPDLVTEMFGVDEVVIAYGQGDGSFANVQTILPSAHGRPLLDDFNGDGHLDVAAYDWLGGRLVVVTGNGDGAFTEGPAFPMDFLTVHPTTGDLNGDGRADAVLYALYTTVRLLLSNPCGCAG